MITSLKGSKKAQPKKKVLKGLESKALVSNLQKVKEIDFVITVTIENSVYQGTGSTALEALQSVPAPLLDLISSGSVKIEHGDKSTEMFFNTMRMKRLLNPYNMEVLAYELAEGM